MDQCLGRHLVPEALRASGDTVLFHADVFAEREDVEDAVWLPKAAQRGWIVVTKDRQIRRRPLELEVIVGAGVRVFVLVSADLPAAAQADAFKRALRKIRRVSVHRGPFVGYVSGSGSVMVEDRKALEHRLRSHGSRRLTDRCS